MSEKLSPTEKPFAGTDRPPSPAPIKPVSVAALVIAAPSAVWAP